MEFNWPIKFSKSAKMERPTDAPNKKVADRPATSPSVLSESVLSGMLFPQYNPDSLIGTKGFGIYREMMLDEQVKAVVRFRRNSTTGRDWVFEFKGDVDLSDDEKQRRIDLFTSVVNQMPGSFSAKLDGIMSAMWQGFSITEKVFNIIKWDGLSWWGIESLRLKPFDTFVFDTDEFGALVDIEQTINAKRVDVKKGAVIHHVFNSEIDENYGQSELREAYRAWFIKDVMIKLSAIFGERMAGGFIVAKADGATVKDGTPEAAKLESLLTNIQSMTGVFLPKGISMEVTNPSNTDFFEKSVSQQNSAIAKALLVPNLLGISEQGPNGSRSLGDTQLEAFVWMLDSEALGLEETLNEQLFTELGDVNFGDGLYPRFRFNALSKSQMMKVLAAWGNLVNAGAVKATAADEEFIRNRMGFPQIEEDETDVAVKPETALNGAQVTALQSVILEVAAGRLPKGTAEKMIVAAFPLNEEQAKAMLADIEAGSLPAGDGGGGIDIPITDVGDGDGDIEIEIPGGSGTGGDGGAQNKGASGADSGGGKKAGKGHGGGAAPKVDDETLGGSVTKIVAKMRATERRVDFVAIDRSARVIETTGVDSLGNATDAMVESLGIKVLEIGMDAFAEDPALLSKLKPEVEDVSAIRKAEGVILREAWNVGTAEAKTETQKAGFKASKGVKFASIEDVAARFFSARSFSVAGDLTDDVQQVIRNSILQGIKGSKSTQTVIEDIYTQLSAKGIVSEEAARTVLGTAFELDNPQHRLATIVRTTSFEALNEARFSFFQDPALGGFVPMLEFSSILDGRVTPICRALGDGVNAEGEVGKGDAHVHPIGDPFWDANRPPNHFNCRSLLIPVTINDDVEETTSAVVDPESGSAVTPQEGFA